MSTITTDTSELRAADDELDDTGKGWGSPLGPDRLEADGRPRARTRETRIPGVPG